MPHHPSARLVLQWAVAELRAQSIMETMAIKPTAVSAQTSVCIAHGRIIAPGSHVLPMTGNAQAWRAS
jgi:hypothetical protein